MENKVYFYVGTYTNSIKFGTGRIVEGKGKGIYLIEFDLKSFNIKIINTFSNILNPSYIRLNKKHNLLFVVNELKEYLSEVGGAVCSYHVDKLTGKISLINVQPTVGSDPCHIELNMDESQLYVSNFDSGSLSVFGINLDGSIGNLLQFIQNSGSSVDPERQKGPHVHSVTCSPNGKFAYVQDLGLDKIFIYEISVGDTPLQEISESPINTKPGSGPRHSIISKGNYYYVINELDSSILVYSHHPSTGGLKELQYISTIPKDNTIMNNTCADIHITPDGNFIYGSNRGHNSLAIFRIDQSTGCLTNIGFHPSGGSEPRNFAIEPSGNFLMCANQDSDNLTVFSIDQKSGALNEVSRIMIPTPVCIQFVDLER